MTSKVRFSTTEDEHLIDMVAGHPLLWDMGDEDFKNVWKKDLIWIEIEKMVNKSARQCKIRWKSIRDHYKRQKKQERNAGTGSAISKKRASYWDRLRFLDSVEDELQSISNTQTENENNEETREEPTASFHSEAEDISVTSDFYSTSTGYSVENYSKTKYKNIPEAPTSEASVSKIRKVTEDSIILDLLKERRAERLQYRKCLENLLETETEDEIDLFFKTMAATVKKFNPEVKTEAKMKIFNLVMDIEMREEKLSPILGHLLSAKRK